MRRNLMTTILWLLCAALFLEVVSRWIFPLFFDTEENLKAVETARELVDRNMPLDPADRQLSETVYNHGGTLGVARRYASRLSKEETARRFSGLVSDSTHSAAGSGVISEGLVVHCFGAYQLSLNRLPQGGGYEVHVARDDTAVRPRGCK